MGKSKSRIFGEASLSGVGRLKNLCIGIVFLSLIACTSLTDEGDELFEKGLFLEAEQRYTAALQKDPKDAEAIEGQMKARVKILDVGLIEVRMLRLGNNLLLAADKLEDIYKKQVDWKVRFNSGIAETQEYETRKAREFLLEEMGKELGAGFPERSQWLYQTHSLTLENSGMSPELSESLSKIKLAGKKRCLEYQAIPKDQDIFLRKFVNRYCSVFGENWNSQGQINDTWVFSQADFQNLIRLKASKNIGINDAVMLEAKLKDVFEASPYFHPQAKSKLSVHLAGTMTYEDRQSRDYRKKRYEVREEQIETVVSKDDKGNPKEEKVKKLVKKNKDFRYWVTIHDETASIQTAVASNVDGKTIKSVYQKSINHKSESHNESNFEAGISPVKANLIEADNWLKGQFSEIAKTFAIELDKVWGQYFCSKVPEDSADSKVKRQSWELIERCGRVQGNHQLVNSFYKNHYHLDYEQMWFLLKKN